ncbi:hypothetical protein UFOVP359_127 [uncultured Caudovirales phage]|uniref:Uncharacterized protein n=1 Tax=uncultured Caudovirales phage TaxID=2100421 RepID=A0A6J7X0N6_9CAUD|nr:hypothetical protein UFOVP359_127 [uncultured Caudovirales phage]
MKILVYGSKSFEDYPTFMRGVVVAIEEHLYKNPNKIQILTAGPRRVNGYSAEFINRSEALFRQKNIRTKFTRVKYEEILENMENYEIDHVVSFNSKSDPDKFFDSIITKAEKLKIPASYYRY